MRKAYLLVVFLVVVSISLGRNYTELQNWRAKGLPSAIKSGISVEVYDLKKASNDKIDLSIRAHNMSSKTVTELNIKVWLWKKEGVFVEEIKLLTGNSSFEYLDSGRDDYFPSKGRYYRIKGINYSEVTRVQVEISRIVSKRVR